MPTKPKPQIKAWSFSRWNTYQKCPAKLKFQAIDRIPEEKGPALIRGQEIHDKAEQYVKGKLKRMPKELQYFEEEFKELREGYKAGYVQAEDMICLDKNYKVVKDKFSPAVWCRIKTDATVIEEYENGTLARVIDYKTGRVQPDPYWEQLELYALGTFQKFPDVDLVLVELWFLDHGEIKPDDGDVEYSKKQLPTMRKDWNARVKKMLSDQKFLPRPGAECRWCSFAASKGGPCKKG